MLSLSALLAMVMACSGANKAVNDFKPLPERFTRATLVGPLCDGQMCTCLRPGDNPGMPASDQVKRYQFKVGPAQNELWVMVDDMVLYKTVERATECFMLDLSHGDHRVTVRAQGENGFSAALEIREVGQKGLYDTFDFTCGSPDACSFDHLAAFKKSLARYRRGIHDPCGATKIRALEWLTGASLDRIHPGDLQLDFIMKVYDFAPKHESGHPECKDRY